MTTQGTHGGARYVCEGVAAGLGLALADALAAGVHRTPGRMLLLMLGLGLVSGIGAGLVAALFKRRGLGLGLVVLFGTGLNGLSLVSKQLGGEAGLFALVTVLALLAGGACLLPDRARSRPALAFVALASIPGASLLSFASGGSSGLILLASALPLLVALLIRLRAIRRNPVAQGVCVLAALVGLVLPVARLDRARERPDRVAPEGAQVAAPDAPDVVLVLVDTLRADALPSGPGLFRRLSEEGVRFERCVSTAPWTLPSVSSILTSMLPSEHGATSAGNPLPSDVFTLAETFAAAGYQTAAFTGGAFVSPAFRMDQGFEHFDASAELGFRPFVVHVPLAWRLAKNRYLPLLPIVRWIDEYPGIEGLCAAADDWLQQRDSSRPCFLLLHTYEAHDYYLYHPSVDDDSPTSPTSNRVAGPSERFAGRLSVHPGELESAGAADLAWFESIYRRRIEHTQRALDRLLDRFDANSARERILALVSDHGEGFDAERKRVHHGGRLHEDLLRVPLLLHAPERLPAGTVVSDLVSTLDVAPTLCELAGLKPPQPVIDQMTGTSLVALCRSRDAQPGREAWSQERAGGRDLLALLQGGWKLVKQGETVRAFELDSDPLEEHPVELEGDLPGDPRGAALGLLRSRMAEFERLFPRRELEEEDLDPSTREHLRALGYLGDDDEDGAPRAE